jgi:hypothetical protein
MSDEKISFEMNQTKIGVRYYPDYDHYRSSEIKLWLPELKSAGISWILLTSSIKQAIPEHFIKQLIDAQIEPIIHFDIPLGNHQAKDEVQPLLAAYSKWGIKTIIFFDKPNVKENWPASAWAQEGIVDRFADLFIPLANAAIDEEITPILPGLEPGGDYWDTTFLRELLDILLQRNQAQLIENLALSAYIPNTSKDLNWGIGGPDRWPNARPYFLPEGEQDQRGFRIFDWYNAITTAILGTVKPMLLLEDSQTKKIDKENDTSERLPIIANLVSMKKVAETDNTYYEPVTNNITACLFSGFDSTTEGTFQPKNGEAQSIELPARLAELKKWFANYEPVLSETPQEIEEKSLKDDFNDQEFLIEKYILLPTYDWGIPEWQFTSLMPFIKKYHPTIGFSLKEAALARHVFALGDETIFDEDTLQAMRNEGSIVERITGDGTTIATILSQR